jgi:hypothetical protein
MGSLGRLRRSERRATADEPGIHIHGDDWGMRNLYPAAAFVAVQSDIEKSAQASIDNLAESGIGWTAVHQIDHPANDYAAAGLDLEAAPRTLGELLPRVRGFTATAFSGFGGKRDPLGSYETDAHCYGFGASCFIKLGRRCRQSSVVRVSNDGPGEAQPTSSRPESDRRTDAVDDRRLLVRSGRLDRRRRFSPFVLRPSWQVGGPMMAVSPSVAPPPIVPG